MTYALTLLAGTVAVPLLATLACAVLCPDVLEDPAVNMNQIAGVLVVAILAVLLVWLILRVA